MLVPVLRLMDLDALGLGVGLEHLKIFIEMGERMLPDGLSKRAHLLPFGHGVHVAITILAQRPEVFVMLLLMAGRCYEALCSFRLIDQGLLQWSGAMAAQIR